MPKLKTALESHPSLGKVTQENETLIAFLTEEMDAATLNRTLFEKGIVLSHLVKRKESLEEQFLELTNNTTQQN
jgi:ABC-2 type transport system ATP-binding protein